MKTSLRRIPWFGPGLFMAASGIGASDVIAATVGGAKHGFLLLWALVLGVLLKFVLSEGLARWQLATGKTPLEGWAEHLPRSVLVYFSGYLVVWTIAVSGALISSCGLAIENITAGAIPRTWGALAHAVAAFLFIDFAHNQGFKRIMKALIIVMFFSIVGCALATFREPLAVLEGLLIPRIPTGAGTYVLSLIGGIGGSMTLLSYNYFWRDEGQIDPPNLKNVRMDLMIAYLFTAVFGISVIIIAHRVFFATGIAITDQEAVSGMARLLARVIGPVGFYIYSLGFWAAVVASLIGVWQAIPRIGADCYSLLWHMPGKQHQAVRQVGSVPYRVALTFMALSSLPFAFLNKPLLVVVAFTVIGSLFIPFLAATLLYLNNKVPWQKDIRHNSWASNVGLVLALVIFVVVSILEISALF